MIVSLRINASKGNDKDIRFKTSNLMYFIYFPNKYVNAYSAYLEAWL